MATFIGGNGHNSGRRWRTIGWGAAALLLLAPFVAMQFTDEVDWTLSDFVVVGVMIGIVGGSFDLATRRTHGIAARAGTAVALIAAFLLVWINLAVGIIGTERDPANLMFAGVIATGVAGAIVARLRPAGMAWAMAATAIVQIAVGVIALAARLGADGPVWPRDVIGLTVIFAAFWLLAAGLFRVAARAPGGNA